MALSAVLDACVLIPLPLADTLLHLAEAGLFSPIWSPMLLEETRRNLIGKWRLDPARADRRIELMGRAFPFALTDTAPAVLVDTITVDVDDKHVAATAVIARASLIVTFNLKHFPTEALSPYGIDAVHPDAFLQDLLDLDPEGAVAALERQRRRLRSPSLTMEAFHQALAVSVPQFVAQVRELTAAKE